MDRVIRLGVLFSLFAALYAWNPLVTGGPLLCPMVWLFELACPFCGVTRGVDALLRGQLFQSLILNPLALVFVVWALGRAVVWYVEWLREIRVSFSWRPVEKKWWDRGVIAVLALVWVYQLVSSAAASEEPFLALRAAPSFLVLL